MADTEPKTRRGRPAVQPTAKQAKLLERVTKATKAKETAIAAETIAMAAAYEDGELGSGPIGRAAGLTGPAVLNRLKAAGVEIRPAGRS